MQISLGFIRHWRFVGSGLISLLACWLLTVPPAAQSSGQLHQKTSEATSLPVTTRNVTPRTYLPGYPTGPIQIDGNWAYLGMGSTLVALDLTDPADPQIVGQLAQPAFSSGTLGTTPLLLQGDYLFFPIGNVLYAVDVSDPTQLRQVGALALTFPIGDIALVDHRLLVGSNTELWVVEIANPATMHTSGYYLTSGVISSIAITGQYAYVIAQGFHIFDISGPNPVWRAEFNAIHPQKVIIAGTRAYALEGFMHYGITVLDLADPLTPTILGTYFHLNLTGQELFVDVAVLNDNLLITDGAALRLLDFSDPTAPQKRLSRPRRGNGVYANVHVAGERVYLTDERLTIFDAATPGQLTELGTYATTFAQANDVVTNGRYAYVADSAGLAVLDLNTPTTPQRVAHLTYPTIHNLYSMVRSHNMLYAAASPYLYAVDITNPISPQVTAVYTSPLSSSFNRITALDQLVIVPGREQPQPSLLLLDASDPTHFTPLAEQPIPDRATDFAVAGHYLYVTAASYLQIIDIAQPAAPRVVSTYTSQNQGMGKFALTDHYAFIHDGGNRINILDVADPQQPTWVDEIHLPASWWRQHVNCCDTVDLLIADHYLYLLQANAGILILDIRNPHDVFEAGRYTARAIGNLAISKDLLLLAQQHDGLKLLTFQPPVTSGTADATGGTLAVTSEPITYTFPAGVFTATTTITHTTRYLEELAYARGKLVAIGAGFLVTATTGSEQQPIQPSQPYTIEIGYAVDQLGPALEESLALYGWDGIEWQVEATSKLNREEQRVVATPTRLGLFALLGATHTLYTPIIMQRSGPQ